MVNSYLLQMVRNHRRDRFLRSLFLPHDLREKVLAIYALDAELAHVRAHVSEEMLGHIRYAWWEESLVAINEGKKPREHPVLIAIAEHKIDALALAQKHRATYPEPLAEDIAGAMAEKLVPQESQAAWNKAGNIIEKHRERFGAKKNGWLAFKLLLAGVSR
jgi:phytoene/squalene synthetase